MSAHSQHDLAIDIVDGEQPPLGPIFDQPKLVLDVMRDCVNECT